LRGPAVSLPTPSWALLLGPAPRPQNPGRRPPHRGPAQPPDCESPATSAGVAFWKAVGGGSRLRGVGLWGSPCWGPAALSMPLALYFNCRSPEAGVHAGPWWGVGTLGLDRAPRGFAFLSAVAHLALARGLSWPPHSQVARLGAALARGFRAPWQRVRLIPVACLFLGNREAGTGTHLCGVLGLARNCLVFSCLIPSPWSPAGGSLW
jgi:hypothetical protein